MTDPILRKMERKQYKLSQEKKITELKELCKEFKLFKKKSLSGEASRNPVHSTNQGIKLANDNKHKEAIRKFDQAILEDKIYSVPARYYKGISMVLSEDKLDESQRQQAIEILNEAKRNIDSKLIPQAKANLVQYGISKESQKLNATDQSDMSKQIEAKINVLEKVKENIDHNIDTIK